MSEVNTISLDEIVQQVKLSYQIPSVVEGIVNRKVIARAAASAGIKAEPKELQQAADSLRLMSNLRSADATSSWLQKHSLSVEELIQAQLDNMLYNKILSDLFSEWLKRQIE